MKEISDIELISENLAEGKDLYFSYYSYGHSWKIINIYKEWF